MMHKKQIHQCTNMKYTLDSMMYTRVIFRIIHMPQTIFIIKNKKYFIKKVSKHTDFNLHERSLEELQQSFLQ